MYATHVATRFALALRVSSFCLRRSERDFDANSYASNNTSLFDPTILNCPIIYNCRTVKMSRSKEPAATKPSIKLRVSTVSKKAISIRFNARFPKNSKKRIKNKLQKQILTAFTYFYLLRILFGS